MSPAAPPKKREKTEKTGQEKTESVSEIDFSLFRINSLQNLLF